MEDSNIFYFGFYKKIEGLIFINIKYQKVFGDLFLRIMATLTDEDFITMCIIQEKLLKCSDPDEIDAIENLYTFLLTEQCGVFINKRPSFKKQLVEKAIKYKHFEPCERFIMENK